MVNHLRDAVKRLAKLSKDVVAASATAAIITANDLHVHETPRTPGNEHISTCQPNEPLTLILNDNFLLRLTRGQSNLTKSASQGAHSPVRGHPRGSGFLLVFHSNYRPRMHRLATVYARDNQPTNDQRRHDTASFTKVKWGVKNCTKMLLLILHLQIPLLLTYVGKPSAVGQPTRPTQPFILRVDRWVVGCN